MVLGQIFRYLHPPAGTVSLIGVISGANLILSLSPLLLASTILFILGISYNCNFKKISICSSLDLDIIFKLSTYLGNDLS